MTLPYSPDRCRLIVLTVEALELADALGLHDAAIHLNEALVRLDGAGQPPSAPGQGFDTVSGAAA